MWTDTASNFWSKWNFLNCRGDHPLKKTHMTTTAPHKSGSLYPDNKKTSSFVLPALLAAYDHLIIVQVGELSGGSVHTGSKLGKDMQSMVLLHPPVWCVLWGAASTSHEAISSKISSRHGGTFSSTNCPEPEWLSSVPSGFSQPDGGWHSSHNHDWWNYQRIRGGWMRQKNEEDAYRNCMYWGKK